MTEEKGFLGIFFKSRPKEKETPTKRDRKVSNPSSGIRDLIEENQSLKERIASLTRPEPVEDEDDA